MSWQMAEYVCACGNRFESLETRPAPSHRKCPGCGKRAGGVIGAPMVRVMTGRVFAARTGSNDDIPESEIPEEWR